MIQRLQNLLELLDDFLGQQLIVMALDYVRIARAGLNHIGINGALGKKVILGDAEFHCLVQKYIAEFRTDDLALALGIGDALQLAEEALLGVDPDEVHIPLGERGFHLVALVLAHTAVIHKDRRQPVAYRLGKQRRQHGGIHTAGQSQQHPARGADFLPQPGHGALAEIVHGPFAPGVAHLIQEIADHIGAVLGVVYLRVELHPVKAPALVGNGHVGASLGMSHQGKAVRHLCHIVAVAHPGNALLRQTLEKLTGGIIVCLGLAVLPGGIVLGRGDPAAQRMGHELAAIADTQHGNAHFKDGRVHMGRAVQIHGIGAAGENDADGMELSDFIHGCGIGLDFAVYIAFPHPPGNELVILAAKIQNKNFFFHALSSRYTLISAFS